MRRVDLARTRWSSGRRFRHTIEQPVLDPAQPLVDDVDRVRAENPAREVHVKPAGTDSHVRVLIHERVKRPDRRRDDRGLVAAMRIAQTLQHVVFSEVDVGVGDDDPVGHRVGLQVILKSKRGRAEVAEILGAGNRLRARVFWQQVGCSAFARVRAVVDHDHFERRVQRLLSRGRHEPLRLRRFAVIDADQEHVVDRCGGGFCRGALV